MKLQCYYQESILSKRTLLIRANFAVEYETKVHHKVDNMFYWFDRRNFF